MIDYDQTLRELEMIVADAPPCYVYSGPAGWQPGDMCSYVHEDADGRLSPGCIVGHWLHRFRGIDLDVLRFHEGRGAMRLTTLLTESGDLAESVHVDAGYFLLKVQLAQDSGLPWADAVHDAASDMSAAGRPNPVPV